jgi:hypothetical protein
MHPLFKLLAILSLTLLIAAPVSAELLVREDFDGISPETFDAYPGWDMQDRDYDFGPFSIVGWFDTGAFAMPRDLPVELPTIGGDNLAINLNAPVSSMGFDLGAANFGETTISFFGVDNLGGPILLDSFLISEIMDEFSGPSGYQGFVGFRDDMGRDIHQVTVGPIDLYLDNVYMGDNTVENETTTLGNVKTLFR